MAGLVGVITHDRAAGLAEPELPALVGAYTALRGHADVEHFSAGRWAAFALIADEAYDDPPIASITSNGDSLTYAQPQICRAQRIQKHLLDAFVANKTWWRSLRPVSGVIMRPRPACGLPRRL